MVSVTCDGPSCHFSMLTALGACLDPGNLKTSFKHQAYQDEINVIFDVCHMLKLVRNTFAVGDMVDYDGNIISWKYVTELQKLQESEGLHLANKLKMAHIKWQQQKMKVNLAAQVLSSSVADAIEYCAFTLKLPQFQGNKCNYPIRSSQGCQRSFHIVLIF